jgi:hypothetical protein
LLLILSSLKAPAKFRSAGRGIPSNSVLSQQAIDSQPGRPLFGLQICFEAAPTKAFQRRPRFLEPGANGIKVNVVANRF